MRNKINKGQALLSLRPNCSFRENGEELEWLDTEQTQPTDSEIKTEIKRLQEEYDNNQYQRDRAAEYPSWQDQADMAYWDRQNGTTILDDVITAVKKKYPKPTGG